MNWYCLVTRIAAEFRALSDLEDRQIEVYLPRLTRIRTTRGQRQEIKAPLMPRYLFICLENVNELCIVRSLSTIQEVLPHEHEPISIPDHEIDSLKQREIAGEFRFRETVTGRKKQRKILRAFQELVILRKPEYAVAS